MWVFLVMDGLFVLLCGVGGWSRVIFVEFFLLFVVGFVFVVYCG